MKDSFKRQIFLLFFFKSKPSSFQIEYKCALFCFAHINPGRSRLTFGFNTGFSDELQLTEKHMRHIFSKSKLLICILLHYRNKSYFAHESLLKLPERVFLYRQLQRRSPARSLHCGITLQDLSGNL